MPVMSSIDSAYTGNLLWPVRRASWMTSSTLSLAATAWIDGRGVMTSAVVSRAKVRVRFSSDAVSCSSTPALAERRTRLDSSSAVRAPDSSSLGSIPMLRRMAFALPLSTATAGRNTVVKPTWNGMTNLAVCRGMARAKFFGTSSPRIIEKIVAIAMATTVEIVRATASGTPAAVNSGLSRFVRAGSIV